MFKMSKTQSKITWYRENQENPKLIWEKTNRNQHQDDTVIRAVGESFDKDFNAGIKMFQQERANTLETNERPESHSKEIEDRENYQMEILELKSAINSIAEWKVSELEDKSTEITHSEQEREKILKKIISASETCGTIPKH